MASKKDRDIIFKKFDGHCYLCGCELEKSWHVDELLPCRRRFKRRDAHWYDGKNRYSRQEINALKLTEQDISARKLKWVHETLVPDGYDHPERLNIDNQMPACASCNINKHSDSLEDFRKNIMGYMKHLNEINTQYKISKRYGLVVENIQPIVFHFEKFKQNK